MVNWVNHKHYTTAVLHQHTIHNVYKLFILNGVDKLDVDNYLKLVESHLCNLSFVLGLLIWEH